MYAISLFVGLTSEYLELIPSDVWNGLIKVFDIDPKNSNTFSDVTFLVEERSIYCHKIVLGLRSHYFKQLFKTNEGK